MAWCSIAPSRRRRPARRWPAPPGPRRRRGRWPRSAGGPWAIAASAGGRPRGRSPTCRARRSATRRTRRTGRARVRGPRPAARPRWRSSPTRTSGRPAASSDPRARASSSAAASVSRSGALAVSSRQPAPPQRRAGAVDADRHLVVDDPDHHERLGVEIVGGGGGRVGGGAARWREWHPLGDGAGVVQPRRGRRHPEPGRASGLDPVAPVRRRRRSPRARRRCGPRTGRCARRRGGAAQPEVARRRAGGSSP